MGRLVGSNTKGVVHVPCSTEGVKKMRGMKHRSHKMAKKGRKKLGGASAPHFVYLTIARPDALIINKHVNQGIAIRKVIKLKKKRKSRRCHAGI
jgi:hypothetical protein